MAGCEHRDIISQVKRTSEQILHIDGHLIILILHMTAHFLAVGVVELQDKHRHLIATRTVNSLNKVVNKIPCSFFPTVAQQHRLRQVEDLERLIPELSDTNEVSIPNSVPYIIFFFRKMRDFFLNQGQI